MAWGWERKAKGGGVGTAKCSGSGGGRDGGKLECRFYKQVSCTATALFRIGCYFLHDSEARRIERGEAERRMVYFGNDVKVLFHS